MDMYELQPSNMMCANEAKHLNKDLLYQSGYFTKGYHIQGMRLSCQCMAIQCRFFNKQNGEYGW